MFFGEQQSESVMGANSKIEWTDHTFNPWVGCMKVSAACDHCYAESWAKRTGHPELWTGERRRTSRSNWAQPLRWNAYCEKHGVRQRVFCASLADVFDNQVPEEWRVDLFEKLILNTPHLDWLLLTKRPQNIEKFSLRYFRWPWPNVWLGTTVENQEEADRRIPHLLAVSARVHFLSCEPLLGPVDLRKYLVPDYRSCQQPDGPLIAQVARAAAKRMSDVQFVDWVIAGGESGPRARPMRLEWVRSIRDQCAAAGVPYHFKQWGEWSPGEDFPMVRTGKRAAGRLLDGVEHNGLPA